MLLSSNVTDEVILSSAVMFSSGSRIWPVQLTELPSLICNVFNGNQVAKVLKFQLQHVFAMKI